MRRMLSGIALAGALALASGLGTAQAQEAPKSVKIGYAISLSGPMAPGAGLTTLPNYRLWVDEVNKAGGLMLKKYGKKVPIEVVELDDNSKAEDLMRLTEKLMAVDKVDIVLTPWSTGFNFAVAPIYAKYGYPQVTGTAGSDKMEEMVAKFPTLFFFLAKNADQSQALVDMMAAAKKDGKINDKVALFIVQAPFGQEYSASLKPALAKAGFKTAYEAVYDAKASDLSTQIKAAKAAGPDTMIALSYPPDTFMITEQSLANDFKPKIRFLGVGSGVPALQGQVRRQDRRRLQPRRLGPERPGHAGLLRAPQGLHRRQGARPLGERRHLRRLAGAAAGDRERGRDRPRQDPGQELKTGTFKTVAGRPEARRATATHRRG